MFLKIMPVVTATRHKIVKLYGSGLNLAGKCIEACEMLVKELEQIGVPAEISHGWILYDTNEHCTGEPCAPHAWVTIPNGCEEIVADVTIDQFAAHMVNNKGISCGTLIAFTMPEYFFREKPSDADLESAGW